MSKGRGRQPRQGRKRSCSPPEDPAFAAALEAQRARQTTGAAEIPPPLPPPQLPGLQYDAVRGRYFPAEPTRRSKVKTNMTHVIAERPAPAPLLLQLQNREMGCARSLPATSIDAVIASRLRPVFESAAFRMCSSAAPVLTHDDRVGYIVTAEGACYLHNAHRSGPWQHLLPSSHIRDVQISPDPHSITRACLFESSSSSFSAPSSSTLVVERLQPGLEAPEPEERQTMTMTLADEMEATKVEWSVGRPHSLFAWGGRHVLRADVEARRLVRDWTKEKHHKYPELRAFHAWTAAQQNDCLLLLGKRNGHMELKDTRAAGSGLLLGETPLCITQLAGLSDGRRVLAGDISGSIYLFDARRGGGDDARTLVAASQSSTSAAIIRRPFWVSPSQSLVVVPSMGPESSGSSVDLFSLSFGGAGGKLASLALCASSSSSSSSSSPLHLCPNSPASLARGGGGGADADAWAQCWALTGAGIVRLGL